MTEPAKPLPPPSSLGLAAMLQDLALDPDTRATIERLLACTLAVEAQREAT